MHPAPALRIYLQDSDNYAPFVPRPLLEADQVLDAKPRAQNRRMTRYEIEAIYVKPRIDSIVSRVDQGAICCMIEVLPGKYMFGTTKTCAKRLWVQLERKLAAMQEAA
jgi:hypothetical protein